MGLLEDFVGLLQRMEGLQGLGLGVGLGVGLGFWLGFFVDWGCVLLCSWN